MRAASRTFDYPSRKDSARSAPWLVRVFVMLSVFFVSAPNQREVFKAVVGGYLVIVVNHFGPKKVATDTRLHDKSVLAHVAAASAVRVIGFEDFDVLTRANSTALPSAVLFGMQPEPSFIALPAPPGIIPSAVFHLLAAISAMDQFTYGLNPANLAYLFVEWLVVVKRFPPATPDALHSLSHGVEFTKSARSRQAAMQLKLRKSEVCVADRVHESPDRTPIIGHCFGRQCETEVQTEA